MPPQSIVTKKVDGAPSSLGSDGEKDFTSAWNNCGGDPSANTVDAISAATDSAVQADRDAAAASAAAAAKSADAAYASNAAADAAEQSATHAAASAADAQRKAAAAPNDAAAQATALALQNQATSAAKNAAVAKSAAAAAAMQAATDAAQAAKMAHDAVKDSESTLHRSAASSCNVQALLDKGMAVIDNRCEDYFERLGKVSQHIGFGVKEWNLLGGTAGAIEGLTGVAAKAVSITSSGFGFGGATAGAYQDAYLFSADVGSVQAMVVNQQKAARTQIENAISQQSGGISTVSRDDVLRVL